MSVLGVVFGIIGLFVGFWLVANIVAFIFGKATLDVDFATNVGNIVGVVAVIVAVVIWASSFFFSPNKEDRYVPEVGIAASLDGKASVNMRDLDVNQSCYLQVKISVKSNSLARKLFGNSDIPFVIEISNPSASELSDPQNTQFCKETKPKEIADDKIVYYYTVVASGSPKTAVLDFQIKPKQTGSQTIKITYDNKVSDIYAKTATLDYK